MPGHGVSMAQYAYNGFFSDEWKMKFPSGNTGNSCPAIGFGPDARITEQEA